jgi:hypothetical protein
LTPATFQRYNLRVRVVTCLLLTFALVAATPSGIRGWGDQAVRHLDRATFEDKVRGGWAGQMVGVSFGAPTEFHSNGKIIEGDLPGWAPDHVSNAIDQDDLYVEMTFAAVMDRVGLHATTEQFGEAFKTSKYELWHANAGARRLLNLGIPAPLSGDPRYNPHANDIDFQIESDFIGLMTPGLPRAARDFSLRVGRVMNSGDGLYGGIFITSMYAAAFFDTDTRRVVEAGLAALPPKSSYAAVIRDVLAWHAAHPDDWKSAWLMLEEKWDRNDACPDGSLQPFNIDAKLNGAYVALGLLYGGGDFSKTLEVATRSGQDSDCNPSSAGGILGVMLGYAKLPDLWKSGIPALAGQKFSYTEYSFDDIVQSTLRRAEKVVVAAGGTVDANGLTIPAQAPEPPPLQQWDMGIPDAIVPASDPAWQWMGAWTPLPDRDGRPQAGKTSDAAGASATLSFTGTALALLGEFSQDGGRATVFLDGEPARPIDAWIPERTHDDALWHVYGLKPGAHTLRIVVAAAADQRSTGHVIQLRSAVVYHP